MDEKIQVLEATIHNDSAKGYMMRMVEYMQQDTFHVVEAVTMKSLVTLLAEEAHKQYLEAFDFTFAGEKEVLEAAGVTDGHRLKEAEDMLFVKMLFRYLHKNRKKVFLLADDADVMQAVTEMLKERYHDIKIVDQVILEEECPSEETIVNQMNGVETDCVLAFMDSPLQEAFLFRNRQLMNTKVWLGLGREFCEHMGERTWFYRLKKFFALHFWKKKIEKEQRRL